MKPHVVFDCVVCLQGAAKPNGPAGACFELMENGQITVSVSEPILAEIADVLNRSRLKQRFKSLTPERVESFLGELLNAAVLVRSVPAVFTYPRDPDDEAYINLALAAGAKFLLTWDKDLLDLMQDNPEGRGFRARFPDLRITTPVDFLRELALQPEGPES